MDGVRPFLGRTLNQQHQTKHRLMKEMHDDSPTLPMAPVPVRRGFVWAIAASSLLAIANPSPETVPDAISWREDYGEALVEARASDHLLWIQFTGPWCPNCQRMEQDSFTDPAIRANTAD